jgi:DNA-binding protein HU-beta
VNKSQLIDKLAQRFDGNRKQAAHALESVLDTITREVARGEKVAITGFGSFERKVRKAGTARNPATGETIRTKKKNVPKFTPGQDLKNIVSGAKKLPKLTVSAAAGATSSARKATAKKSPAKKTSSTAKSTAKAPAKKASTAKKATAKKAPAKKASTAKKSASKSTSAAKKSTAKKSSAAKKSTAKKSSAAKKAPAKKTTAAKKTAKKAAKKS